MDECEEREDQQQGSQQVCMDEVEVVRGDGGRCADRHSAQVKSSFHVTQHSFQPPIF